MKKILVLAALLGGTPFLLFAQEAKNNWDYLASVATPSWQTVDDPAVESRPNVLELESEDGRQIVYELIPKGQSDRNWRKRHWVYVAEDVSKSLVNVRNAYLRREGEVCAAEPKWADWDKSARELVFAYFCGERKTDGRGYVAVIWMSKKSGDLFRVSEEWRGKPYDFGNESTYFWEREALTNLIANIGASELN